MTTAILASAGSAEGRLVPLLRALAATLEARRRAAADRRALARARHVGPRLLDDMGIAPEARPLVGDWDALLPNGYLVHPLR